ncbi:MAG: hypothetical protein QOG07_4338 [Pseudonocardiales bacterium]|nr:hypothetical protein [Pseudonocardiales bacterium]
MARLRDSPIRGGLLSVEEAAALATAGFEPVSEVLGAVANRVNPRGSYSVTLGRRFLSPDYRTFTSSSKNAAGISPAMSAVKAGYRTALRRLRSEAIAVGADGVVGVRLSTTVVQDGEFPIWGFLALGTAVRAAGSVHTPNPFTTDLSGAQTAAAIRSGWIPVSYLITPCRAIRVVDPLSIKQRARTAPNGEVDAYTDAVTTCRRQARTDFLRAAENVHAHGAVLSTMSLDVHLETKDVAIAEVTISGTALARFTVPDVAPGSLTIIPLKAGIR